MLNDGEFQSEQIGSFFSFAKASDEFGVSLIGEARIPKRSAQLCETILRMYDAIRYNKLRKFQNRRIENSPQNKGQGQRHLVE